MHCFTKELLKWNLHHNARALPWKGEKDPYKIWLSEIILQQTRTGQGLNYYLTFLKHFPDVKRLALAPEQEVFKLWEGLGYYNRCKNLIATARDIYFERKGIFPRSHEEILSLRGVGPYTAAAIASFAYNQPFAVVDGNVKRVLTRYFGIKDSPDTQAGHKKISQLAQKLIPETRPAQFNQAIMDFGATICKPKPLCSVCPLRNNCFAYQHDRVNEFPVRIRKIKRKTRYFNYLILHTKDSVYLAKRRKSDIWQNLYEPFLIESTDILDKKSIVNSEKLKSFFKSGLLKWNSTSEEKKQELTHQTIIARFHEIEVTRQRKSILGWEKINLNKLARLPFPKIIAAYFSERNESVTSKHH